MSAPDIRQDREIAGFKYTYGPVDDDKLKAEVTRVAYAVTSPQEQFDAITALIDAVREADSDQSCGCM